MSESESPLDTQALEQILIGHVMAICGEANQIFGPVTIFDYVFEGERLDMPAIWRLRDRFCPPCVA